MARTATRGRTATRTATGPLTCRICDGVIRKGWSYRSTGSGKAEHFNAAHWPACHDPSTCNVCVPPGQKLYAAQRYKPDN